jgi:hypothetical protein
MFEPVRIQVHLQPQRRLRRDQRQEQLRRVAPKAILPPLPGNENLGHAPGFSCPQYELMFAALQIQLLSIKFQAWPDERLGK